MSSKAPWRSPYFNEKDATVPWDVCRIEFVLREALQPKATIETKLRAANTLRRCAEMMPEDKKKELLAMASLPSTLLFLITSVDDSAAGARIQEHSLYVVAALVGMEERFDEFMVLDDESLAVIASCLNSRHLRSQISAAHLIRRVSELEAVAHVLVFHDDIFNVMLHVIEASQNEVLCAHILCTLMNLAGNAKVAFSLSRCLRLLRILEELIVSVEQRIAHATFAVKIVANLLSYSENVAELTRLAPALINEILDAQQFASQKSDASLVQATHIVLEFIHEADPHRLHSHLANELAEKAAASHRIRSTLLAPQRNSV